MGIGNSTALENNTVFLSGVESRLNTVAGWFAIISAISLFFMMGLTAVDVFGRWLFTKPLFGTYELVGHLLIIAGPFAMAITQLDRKHISISLVADMLPQFTQKILQILGLFLDLFVYGMITVGLFYLTSIYWKRGVEALSEDLGFSLVIPAICYALAALLYTLIIVVHFIQSLHTVFIKE
jgi:TRAP-type transport system small permease protein